MLTPAHPFHPHVLKRHVNKHNKRNKTHPHLGHVLNEEVAAVLGLALRADQLLLVGAVLLYVLLGALEDVLADDLCKWGL
jgi:hypothetical protein